MPLTSISQMYKTFPSYFADTVTQHVRKRTECYKGGCARDNSTKLRGTHGGNTPRATLTATVDSEVSAALTGGHRSTRATPSNRPQSRGSVQTTKRSNTPLAAVSDAESDGESSRPRPHDQSSVTTPRSRTSPRSRSSASKHESPRPLTSVGCCSPMAGLGSMLGRGRLPQSSPRTTSSSLDNVDLWEESEDSDAEPGSGHRGFDKINGVPINPRNTIDLSDLRRSRSPVACKRNKLDQNPPPRPHNMDIPPFQGKESTETGSKIPRELRRLRMLRKSPQVLPNLEKPLRTKPAATAENNLTELTQTSLLKQQQPVLDGKMLQKERSQRQISNAKAAPSTTTTTPATAKSSQASKARATVQSAVPATRHSRDRTVTDSQDNRRKRTDKSASPNSRRVKFNNLVTVEDGEFSTLDLLRNSHNSAQLFKQRHLPSHRDSMDTSHHSAGHQSSHRQTDAREADSPSWGLMVC